MITDRKEREQFRKTTVVMNKKLAATSSNSRLWAAGLDYKDGRIVRVSRALGGKDRHSKVRTMRGLRDRRVRLSVATAIELYDLQDRLGLNQPSKVVDWLLHAAHHEIDKLPPLHQSLDQALDLQAYSKANNNIINNGHDHLCWNFEGEYLNPKLEIAANLSAAALMYQESPCRQYKDHNDVLQNISRGGGEQLQGLGLIGNGSARAGFPNYNNASNYHHWPADHQSNGTNYYFSQFGGGLISSSQEAMDVVPTSLLLSSDYMSTTSTTVSLELDGIFSPQQIKSPSQQQYYNIN